MSEVEQEDAAATTPGRGAPSAATDPRVRRWAYVSLGVGLAAVVAFLVGLQAALQRIPPELTAAQADSVRRVRAMESRRGAGDGSRPVAGTEGGMPDDARQRTQPAEYPRLR